jgi:hypothetical protein
LPGSQVEPAFFLLGAGETAKLPKELSFVSPKTQEALVMNRIWTGAALALLWGGFARADDPPKNDPPSKQDAKPDNRTPTEKFAEAKKAQGEAEKTFNKVIADMRAKKEKLTLENKDLKAAFDARNKSNQAAVEAAKEVVKADPTSPAGFEAITFVVNANGATPEIIKILMDHHVANPKIGSICSRLGFGPANAETKDFLKAVMEKNPDKDAQGNAAFTLSQLLMRNKPEEAEKLLEKIAKDYKDVKWFRGTLGERAESNLFELRHLQVGKVAPEIEGEDMEGKKFKLSDYRGKVVMLDFWGHW